jgi:hypothetical protein
MYTILIQGVVTRRPLELRLHRLLDPTAKPYAIFDKENFGTIYDFADIKAKIEALTEKVCGSSKGIIDDPIILNVYSPSCPDLTLIDLPGITRIAQEGQAKNIEEVTKNMAARYCGDERTIILCVIPANQDMSTSDGLQMAMKLDPNGERTIGVITKIDIMDRGTNAKKMLLNEDIKLKLGYVGVKGRSQADIKESMKVGEALKEERNYFARHPVYSNLPPGCVGTEALVGKLTSTMYRHIKRIMPSIINEIDSKIFECEKNYKELGTPLPVEDREKLLLIWRLISTFSERVKTSISGEYNPTLSNVKKDLLGGVRIRLQFNELFIEEMSLKYKASKKYGDTDIKTALRLHMGNNLPGFTSADAFQSLINPLLQKLKDPAMTLLEEVHAIMEQICVHYINETFMRFPMFISEVTDAALTILTQDKERARLLMSEIIDANIGYMYTKDPEYIACILPSSEKERLDKQREKEKKAADEKAREAERNRSEANLQDQAGKPPVKQATKEAADEDGADDEAPTVKMSKDKVQKAMEKVLIKEMRLRIDTYFRVVVTQLADMIPKLIGHNLVNAGINSLQFSVFKKVSAGSISDMLKEPEHIIKKRDTLKRMLDTLTASRKILLRDPDLAYSLEVKSSSEFLEMKEKDKARKMTAAKEKKKTLMEKASEAMTDMGKAIKTGVQDVQKKFAGDEKQNTSTSTQQSTSTATKGKTPFDDVKGQEPQRSPTTNVAASKPLTMKSDAELAKDAANLAWQHKDTIIKVAKENPELVDKGVKMATQAAQQPAPATGAAGDPKKTRLQGLFGF